MARKQLGMVDDALLDDVDRRALGLGQTRRTFVERALERHIEYVDEVSQTHRGVDATVAVAEHRAALRPASAITPSNAAKAGVRPRPRGGRKR
jgi:hypothetical protein